MGYKHIRDLAKCEVSPIKEHVGDQSKNVSGETSHAKKAREAKKSNEEEEKSTAQKKTFPRHACVVLGK